MMFRISVASSVAIKKFRFVMRLQDMAQNRFFSDAIEREAIKARANAHHHNCLPGKDIALKST